MPDVKADPVREQLARAKREHARAAGMAAPSFDTPVIGTVGDAQDMIEEHAEEAGKEPCERCLIYARAPRSKHCRTCGACLRHQAQMGTTSGLDKRTE